MGLTSKGVEHVNEIEARLKGLLLDSLDGDERAYGSFLRLLTGYLRHTLRRRLYSHEDEIEDVLQEVLLALHKGLHTYRRQVPLTAWVAAIVRHKVADYLSRRASHEALWDPLDDETELFVESEVETVLAKRDVESLLRRLPERQRVPIEYVKLNGLSVAEVAAATGQSESAVKVAIHRGLKALTRMIRA